MISLTQIADIPPTLLGGVLTDGTYYMTSDVTYTGPGGASGPTGDTIRDEIIISNAASGVATMNEASVQNGGPDSFDSVTLTTSGTSLIIDPICPSTVGPVTFQFTATASTLTVEYMDKVVTFEKQ